MKKKDLINEYIGIASIVVIVVFSVCGIYFFMTHQPQGNTNEIIHNAISSLATNYKLI